jgi:hypothetical protein
LSSPLPILKVWIQRKEKLGFPDKVFHGAAKGKKLALPT